MRPATSRRIGGTGSGVRDRDSRLVAQITRPNAETGDFLPFSPCWAAPQSTISYRVMV